ncbi:hypothetical protein Dester_0148 [Desulfurobacterium thermolithotrophum DSM 11699]|uniref:CopG-like ribbon-helix-helix domain-containing protein n=1 Tax=Desulfurobacterium thermolithotrophum (strain DSM 11699 / BSA) TaxID=868864 RepID=F0S102_DESTD|nr:DUF6290 family protein [Desulfurobacterium thermolithotrophum]ADY72806.1 hypothetical protein Dester_0148 [Desulfurobacterium thermolithotrophum DSM 11699]
MPTKNPRINIVLEESLYEALKKLSKESGLSLSRTARELIKEALELREDVVLVKTAEERDYSFDREKALTHEEIWNEL